MKIAVLSDTHGLLRDSVLKGIQDVEMILHGGDVGSRDILEQLQAIAPVHVVRGNTDHGPFGESLPLTETVQLDPGLVYMVHDIADLDIDPCAAGISMVVSGHSHAPSIHEREGVRFLNPGSIGPRRFHLPISYAMVDWHEGAFACEFITLAE